MNKFLIIILVSFTCYCAKAQNIAVKANLLYGATLTPNLGAEIGLGKRSTLEIQGGYNPWNLEGKPGNNKKLVHWLGEAEFRYWFCQRFVGHFIGIHALGSQYNISQHELPLLFGKGSKDFRQEGYAVGGGFSYGYQFILSRRWSVEATIGIGYARLEYDKYGPYRCSQKIESTGRNYFGPTKAGISLLYVIK